jgi:hypothetical protein
MSYFGTGWRSIWRSVGIARQRSALNMLSDHMLKDIGLSRSDIESITATLADGRTDAFRRRRGR